MVPQNHNQVTQNTARNRQLNHPRVTSQPFISGAFRLGVRPPAGCPAATPPWPQGVIQSTQTSRRTTGLDQAVKLGLLRSRPGHACSPGKFCRSQGPPAACAASPPPKDTLPSGNWPQGVSTASSCQWDTNICPEQLWPGPGLLGQRLSLGLSLNLSWQQRLCTTSAAHQRPRGLKCSVSAARL